MLCAISKHYCLIITDTNFQYKCCFFMSELSFCYIIYELCHSPFHINTVKKPLYFKN